MAVIFDEHQQGGITLVFEQDEIYLENVAGVPMFAVFMEDEEAEELIALIQNKLNARRL